MADPGNRGGARPGAGRPRRADKFARPIALAEKRIADRLPQLIDRLFELAEGVRVADAKGEVYEVPPNLRAIQECLNHVMGKPIERHVHDVDAQISGYLAELATLVQEEDG